MLSRMKYMCNDVRRHCCSLQQLVAMIPFPLAGRSNISGSQPNNTKQRRPKPLRQLRGWALLSLHHCRQRACGQGGRRCATPPKGCRYLNVQSMRPRRRSYLGVTAMKYMVLIIRQSSVSYRNIVIEQKYGDQVKTVLTRRTHGYRLDSSRGHGNGAMTLFGRISERIRPSGRIYNLLIPQRPITTP
jgi:hypothetical protein